MNSSRYAILNYILFACAYFGSGYLLSTLSFYDQIVPVWLPAGIALVGAFLWGWQFLPAIFVASMVFNYTASPATAISQIFTVAGSSIIIIALGATLQAWVGSYLLKNWLGNPITQPSTKKTLWFIVCVGFLVNLISANIGVSALSYLTNAYSENNYWLNMTYWWLGDSVGVLLVTPFLLSLIDYFEQKPLQRKIHLITMLSSSFLFVAVLLLTSFFIHYANKNSQTLITREVKVVKNSLYREINNSLSQLHTLANFIQTTPNLSQQSFQAFAQNILTANPAIHALSWNPSIEQHQREAAQEELSDIYQLPIEIKGQPLEQNDPIVYVKYIHPIDGNAKAIGYNVFSNDARKETLLKATESFYPRATPIIQLVQTTTPQPAYLLFIPVFQLSKVGHQSVQRNIKGFATGVFLINKMMEEAFDFHNNKIFDYELIEPGKDTVFHSNMGNQQQILSNETNVQTLIFDNAGQQWQLNLALNQPYLKYQQSRSHLMLFIFQFCLVICLMTMLLIMNNRHLVLNGLVRERTKSLQLAMEESKQASKAKSRFLANMSHEIRTPLNSVVGFSQLARASIDKDEIDDYLAKIEISSDILLSLVNDILDFSKIESGKLKLSSQEMNIHQSLKRISTIFGSLAEQKHLKWSLTDEIPETLHFYGDQARIEQVLVNLCSNAIKFTQQGEVAVTAALTRINSFDAAIKISVRDTGIGISLKNQQKLFTLFTQADDSTSRNYGGTGLGLAISRELSQLMGGNIEINSQEGQGAEFIFSLTLPICTETIDEPTEFKHQDLRHLKVLVAEDNRINQKLIGTILAKHNITPVIVDNGQQAIDTLEQEHFDVILMDCQMPVLDGYQATQAIRAMPNYTDLPIIALTADANKESIEYAEKVGFSEHLTKPINVAKLIDSLEKISRAIGNSAKKFQ